MKIILGSSSAHRRRIMERMGFEEVEFASADIDEKAIRNPEPRKLTLALAAAKAEALVARLGRQEALLVTGDTVMTLAGEVIEKPVDAAEARSQLSRYGGAAAPTAVAGIRVTRLDDPTRFAEGVATATIRYRTLPEEVVAAVSSELITLTMAGAHSIDHPLVRPHVTSIEGDEETVYGMPIGLVRRLIAGVSGK